MAKSAVALLVMVLCVSAVRAQGQLVKPCNNSRSTSLSFSIVSRKNQTGHWIAEVKMGPEITDAQHNGGWQIHVDQNTVDNSGLEPIVQIRATITAPAPVAGPGYELFPGLGYYKLHTEGKTWQEARDVCIRENAHLAIINSEAESDVIQRLLKRYPNLGGPHVAAFIGFHDMVTEGQYITIYDEPLASTGFTRWSTIGKQPDDAPPGEDCGSVHRNGGLNDLGCDAPAPFICEQELYPPSNVGQYDKDHKITTTARPHYDIDVRINDDDVVKPKDKPTEPIFVIDEVPAE